jgi:DNA polymerase III sliding clamp (beta) subunit (PCNA family)
MKITIEAKTLLESLKRGGFSALSDDASSDSSTLSTLIRSVKIEAKQKEIIFESATSLSASKYILPISDEVKVHEEGVVMVLAKELYNITDKQVGLDIYLESKMFDAPKSESVGSISEDVASKASIKQMGDVIFKAIVRGASTDKKGKVNSSLTCYDHSQLPSINIKEEDVPLFIAPIEQLTDGIKNIGFSSMQKDSEHLFDSISFQHKDKALYMVSTDCARCALWLLPNADKISMKSTVTVEDLQGDAEALSKAWEHNLLVPLKMLSDVAKLSTRGCPLGFYRDADKNWVYMSQPNFIVRASTADKSSAEKFPPLDLFLVKKFKKLCKADVSTLLSRLNTVALINSNSILFSFKDDELVLDAISEMGKSPCSANLEVEQLQGSFRKVWNVKHFQDLLKNSGKEIVFEIADDADKGSMKITSPSHNAVYFVMAVERSKYNV